MYKNILEYRENVLKLRKSRTLHPKAEEMFVRLLRQLDKDVIATPESATLSKGHRVDLKFHLKNGRVFHVEIFASKTTVSRDINSLLNSSADVCMVMILDDSVDKAIADAYFHELKSRKIPSDHFPVFKLSTLMVKSQVKRLKRDLSQLLGLNGSSDLARIPLENLRQPAMDWYVSKINEKKVIDEFLQNFKSSNVVDLFVTGPRGIGKSSFLNVFERIFNTNDISIIKRTVDTENWNELLSVLIAETESLVDKKGFKEIEYNKSGSVSDIFKKVAVNAASKFPSGIVYIIDQFERLFERGIEEVTQLEVEKTWRSFTELSSNIRSKAKVAWIIASREQYYFMIFPLMGNLSDYNFTYLSVQPFQENESIKLIQKASDLTRFKLTKQATKTLAEQCLHHPQNILLSFINIFRDRKRKNPVDIDELQKMQPWSEVFEADLRRVTKAEKTVLFAIAESLREIISFEDIQARLTSHSQISESSIRSSLRSLQNKMSLIKQPRQDVFEFFHARFADYIREKHGHEFPSEWSAQRLIETALSLVVEGDIYTAGKLMNKAIKISTSNYTVYFRAVQLLRRDKKYISCIEILLELYDSTIEIYRNRLRQLNLKLGWEKAKHVVDEDGKFAKINRENTNELIKLTQKVIRYTKNPVEKAEILCRVAENLMGEHDTIANDLIEKASNIVLTWRKKHPKAEFGFYIRNMGDIFKSFGKEEAAFIVFLQSAKSGGYRSWDYTEHKKAMAILRKRGQHKKVLNLCIEAFNIATGQANKARYLFDAAKLADEINDDRSNELYKKLAKLVKPLKRTSRTDGAKKKWSDILEIAMSNSK